jgi:kynurenine formamidase
VTTIIDLSHRLTSGMITYPGLPGPVITDYLAREASRKTYAPGYEFQIGRIDMVANTGTYLDTPFHRFADGYDLAGLDLQRVTAVPGIVIDSPARGPVDEATLADLDLRGKAVLFRTGWSRHFGTDLYGDVSHPGLTAGAAAVLAA